MIQGLTDMGLGFVIRAHRVSINGCNNEVKPP